MKLPRLLQKSWVNCNIYLRYWLMHMSKHHTKVQIWIPHLRIIQISTVEQNYFVKYSDQIYKDELVSSTNLKTGQWFPDICISVFCVKIIPQEPNNCIYQQKKYSTANVQQTLTFSKMVLKYFWEGSLAPSRAHHRIDFQVKRVACAIEIHWGARIPNAQIPNPLIVELFFDKIPIK